MTTMNQSSPKRHDGFAMFTPPARSWLDVFATKYGIFSASLAASAALIAVTVWILFFYIPNRELAPDSTASVGGDAAQLASEDSDSLFAPTGSQSELKIRPPTLETPVAAAPDQTVSSAPAPAVHDEVIRPAPSAVDESIATVQPLPLSRTALHSGVRRPNKTKDTVVASRPRSKIDRATNKSKAARSPVQSSRLMQDSALALPPDKQYSTETSVAAELNASVDPSIRIPGESAPATSPYPQTPVNINSVPREFASISTAPSEFEPREANTVPRKTGLAIIVNKENLKSLTRSDISNIYRDRITRWPSGERILVLNLPLDSGERHQFSTAILEMSPMDAATELSNRTITNRLQNVYRTKTAQAIVSYVERDANAIGYVPAGALTEDNRVRVVLHIP